MGWDPHLRAVQDDRHRFFLREAYRAAWHLSDDPNTKVGAALVHRDEDRYRLIARAANHVRRDVECTDEELAALLQDRTWKYKNIVHAEEAVITVATERGMPVRGTTMYMPWVPCDPCAERVLDAGIAVLVTHEPLVRKTPERWWESTNRALDRLAAAGVECLTYAGAVGGVHSVFNDEIWQP